MAGKGRGRGVPKGYVHKWRYSPGRWHEKKVASGGGKKSKWKFVFKSTKTRKGSGKGGPPVGFSITWDIKGKQTATKTGPRTYATTFVGEKTVKKTKMPKKGRRKK